MAMGKRLLTLVICTISGFIFIAGNVDLDNLFNYANQTIPEYITKDNTTTNVITDEIATLGRVLFYDKKLSANNQVSCASCHKQEMAFSDSNVQSIGLNNGPTGRHSMRLINARFSEENKFFWDERATKLEDQVIAPIKDHIEMGFSGNDGDPDIHDLCEILNDVDYYQRLFTFAFGDATVTEERIQFALAQFVRSIQSFDSKFDEGLVQVNQINHDFPNFTDEENLGKKLFLSSPNSGGAGCITCHLAPEFDIHPQSLNNGIISVAGSDIDIDLTNTRAPSLRDLVNPNGQLNGPLMHDGSKASLDEVIEHYNAIPNNPLNTNLDRFLSDSDGVPQSLNLTEPEKNALVSFLKTLTGTDVYINEKWSNPFGENGSINLVGNTLASEEHIFQKSTSVYPNPVKNELNITIEGGNYRISIYDLTGKIIFMNFINSNVKINCSNFSKGIYILTIDDLDARRQFVKKIIKK